MQHKRQGIFLGTYCLFPFVALIVAAAMGTNVSARYLLFTLPGVLLGASYCCMSVLDQVRSHGKVIGWAMIIAVMIPSLQSNYLYFTSGYGHRSRLDDAMEFIGNRLSDNDKVFLVKGKRHPEERRFNLKLRGRLLGFKLEDDQFIFPLSPEQIDLGERIWVITIGREIKKNPKGLFRWIRDHTQFLAEFRASRGPFDNSVRVYLQKGKWIAQE